MGLKNKLHINDSRLNEYANHLIVIFILTMPLLISVRRLSLFLLVVLFFVRGRIAFYVSETAKDPVIRAFLLYFLVHVVWLVGTDDYEGGKSVMYNAKFLLLPLLFGSFIDEKYIPRMKVAFFVGMFASILVSFGIFTEILPPMPHYGNQGVPSDPTPVYHRTHYGFMLAVSSVLALYYLIKSDSRAIKIMAGIFFIFASLNIFITGGRFGYVLYVVGILIIIVTLGRKLSLKMIVFLVMVVLSSMAAAYHMSSTFEKKIEQTTEAVKEIIVKNEYASSIGGRVGIVKYSIPLVKENWFLGIGTGDQTGEIIKEIRGNDKNLAAFFKELGHPHNEYLSALLQFGIVGLFIFLSIPASMIRYDVSGKEGGDILKILGISILLFSLVDILVLGLGMLFTVVVLTSINLRNYATGNAVYSQFSVMQGMHYIVAIIVFYVVQAVVSRVS